MFLKVILSFIFIFAILDKAKTDLTFKNVMVICENEYLSAHEEITFVTTVTANSLRQHLPSGQNCFRIEIEHSLLPTLYEGSFANIDHVHYLLLENNNIQEIYPGAFTNLKVQEGMSLKHNKLTEIRKGVFNNVVVPVLYLSSNYISKIHPQAFDDMPALEAIHLDSNQLTYIDNNWFRNTPKLHKLIFRYNNIERVPRYAFKNLVSKRYNELQVDLSHNLIRFVTYDAFKKPDRFEYLSLANNQISTLTSDWLKNVHVRKLDISNNSLQCLVNDGLAGQSSTNFIDGNPWLCTCLFDMKKKQEQGVFGTIVADQEFKRCGNVIRSLKLLRR